MIKQTKQSKNYIEYKNISDLNSSIKKILEESHENIKVSGEISNLKISNNNLFATLKDNDSMINVISWGYLFRKNKINISNGDNVLIYGKILHYSKSGSYCLSANLFEKIGTGNLYQEYEQLKLKYEQLGYFILKKIFPQQLDRIGIVTALEGAALQDILYVMKNNEYSGKIIIKGCFVQGNQAPQSISESINSLIEWKDLNNKNKNLDIIIIARGGGSFEDLIAFSSPIVIETIHKCPIYTISAIGHEIDFMLSDFVADQRAPTPSIAAEIVSAYNKNQLIEYKKNKSFIINQMNLSIHSQLNEYKIKISLLSKSLNNLSLKLSNDSSYLETTHKNIKNKIKSKLLQVKNKLENLSNKLQKYDIHKMLEQGYIVLTKNNKIISSTADIKIGGKLKLKMKDGEVNIIVEEII